MSLPAQPSPVNTEVQVVCPKCGHARTAADVAMHVVEHAQIKKVRPG